MHGSIHEGMYVRSTDGVVSLAQDNSSRKIIVKDANPLAMGLLGITSSQMEEGLEIQKILPLRINEMISDFVEFIEGERDIGDVLSRVRNFTVINNIGNEIPVSLKILNREPYGRNARFDLLLRDLTIQLEFEAKRRSIVESLRGFEVLDEITGLPNRPSLLKELEMVTYFVGSRDINASFVIVEISQQNHLEESFGRLGSRAIRKSVAQRLKSALREGDSIGMLDSNRYGVILMDADKDSTMLAINRLRISVTSQPIAVMNTEFTAPRLAIGNCQISAGTTIDETLKRADESLTDSGRGVASNAA